MEDLSLDDIDSAPVGVVPVTFLGKQAYIRKLTFDGQIEVSRRFTGREDEEATAEDMRMMLAMVLCDKNGRLLFSDPDAGASKLAHVEGSAVVDLFGQAKSANGWDAGEEAKNLNAVR
ncbi:MAG: hypothetical protein O2780_12445 [Proteobacteria bacterium]|nr:hypothetical protein [Pseudomonadota bacterium]